MRNEALPSLQIHNCWREIFGSLPNSMLSLVKVSVPLQCLPYKQKPGTELEMTDYLYHSSGTNYLSDYNFHIY